MDIRDYSLPAGWFPRDSASVIAFLKEFNGKNRNKAGVRAAIAPHAGWYYCGRVAALGISGLCSDAETVVILGGHLPAGSPALFAMEDAVKTPFGYLPIDTGLRDNLLKELSGAEDRYRDNTIEVLLPMVHYFLPKARLLWIRLPAEISSFEAGKKISQAALKLNRRINVLASTDLTHYGLNYGFSPQGSGKAALHWVREVNDANFIKAVESGNKTDVLRCAEQENAACSAGAVLGVMGFAEAESLGNARLLDYSTSADITGEEAPDSFVGYASFIYK
ncbi:MAG: AmmeMemoRadiSam system protein B [Treponema sp.]|nr:AmmeMemoRadiSam system protein B [Treponema sp.]